MWGDSNGECLLICFFTSGFNFDLYTWFYSLSQASAGFQSSSSSRARSKGVMELTKFQTWSGSSLPSWCSRPSRCACAAPHTWILFIIMVASLILVILSVTVHVFMCPNGPKTHKWRFPLFNSLRSWQLLDTASSRTWWLKAFLQNL